MTIEVKINKITGDGKMKAYASVTFDGQFAVHGIKVIEGANGLFVGMPNRKSDKEDKYLDIAHPVTKEFQKELSDAVLDAYQKA